MPKIIKIQDLTKKYHQIQALQGITLDVMAGSFVSILGSNGAGKSTLNHILAGLTLPTTGIVEYDEGTKLADFQQYIGMVFQHNVCDPLLTVEENLLFYGGLVIKNKKQLQARYQELQTFIGFASFAKQRFKTLSGGEKRLVEIARALFILPKLLILDEPTTGLDPQNRKRIWEIIQALRSEKKTTILLTTHYLEEALISDQVFVLKDGLIRVQGTPNEIINKYSQSKVIIQPNDLNKIKKYLTNNKFEYKILNEEYIIKVNSTKESVNIISDNSNNIKYLKVIPGTLDDAYLQIIGDTHE